METVVPNGFASSYAALALAMAQDHNERRGRQSDATQVDNRGLNAAVFKSVTESDNAEIFGAMNAASHVPTSQPWMTPPWVNTGFKPTV